MAQAKSGRKITRQVGFTEQSYQLSKHYAKVLGFGSVTAFIQAAIVEYLTNRYELVGDLEKRWDRVNGVHDAESGS